MIKFSTIIPRPLNREAMKLALIEGMRDIGLEIRENFEDTTRTWNHQPSFNPPTGVPKVGVDEISVETSTTDKIYTYVSEGTRSHPIFPTNAKALAFSGKFIPKTHPGIIGSGVGFEGGDMQYRNWVAHPGVEARKFDREIKERQEKNFNRIMQNSIKIARKASGHAL
jgi:hypothetical protein